MPRTLLYIILLFILSSCNQRAEKERGIPVARVNQTTLYANDLSGIVPKDRTAEDSIRMTKDYIDNWVRQQLLLDLAEKSLTLTEKDVEKQLREYRRSLLIYELKSNVLKQRLDTMVSDQDIQEYYDENQGNFELKENIVKVLYVKLSPETPELNNLRRLIRSDDENARLELEEYCSAYAVNYFLGQDTWLYFNDLLKEIPIDTYNQESFLRNNRYLELKEESYLYFIRILDFRIRESVSPLSLEQDKIRNILINKRKINLINEFEQNVFDQALKDGEFELY